MEADFAIGLAPDKADRQAAQSSPRAALLRMPPLSRARRIRAPPRSSCPSTRAGAGRWTAPDGRHHPHRPSSVGRPGRRAIPVGIVAGQSGYLQARHQTDMSKGDLGVSAEARSRDCAGSGQTEVFVDDDNPIGGPAWLALSPRRTVGRSPRGRARPGRSGLAQIDDGHAGKVTGVDLLDVTRRLSPALSRPRAAAR